VTVDSPTGSVNLVLGAETRDCGQEDLMAVERTLNVAELIEVH